MELKGHTVKLYEIINDRDALTAVYVIVCVRQKISL